MPVSNVGHKVTMKQLELMSFHLILISIKKKKKNTPRSSTPFHADEG